MSKDFSDPLKILGVRFSHLIYLYRESSDSFLLTALEFQQ